MKKTGTGTGSSDGHPFRHPDPNLPRLLCQNCHQSLSIHPPHADADHFLTSGMQGSSFMGCGSGSVTGSIRMDHSFVVLPTKKSPPQSQKAIDESFVVLNPPAAASKSEPVNPGFDITITILNRAFKIATSRSEVDLPICLKCMHFLLRNLDEEVEDANRDIRAYEASLKRLEAESKSETVLLSDAEFLAEKLKAEEEERELMAAIAEADKQCGEVTDELKELDFKLSYFKELEDRYWHKFNDYQLKLLSYEEERDAIMVQIEGSRAQLKFLSTNVVRDAFPIGCDGEFGTINNFRL